MADTIVYNVPLARLDAFRGRHMVVRSERPAALMEHLGDGDLDDLAYVQLHSLPESAECLIHWAEGLAIDLVLSAPAAEFPRLYRYAKLLDNHPVRVSVPVVPGFEKAVKVAASLQFAVRLQLGQPDDALVDALARVLDGYLHHATMAQPIEYFHSLLLALCHGEPASIWAIQEDDPALTRHVDEVGDVRPPSRLAGADAGADLAQFVPRWGQSLLAAGAECAGCAYFAHCGGYFKWPRRDYSCAGVKALFHTLHQAASALRQDLDAAEASAGGRS